jgi:hypothetical protein
MYMKKVILNLLALLLFGLNSCSDKPDLVFGFIGDLHYSMPDYQTAKHIVPQIAKELDTLKVRPEFMILTGDFFHGARGADIERESGFAFQNFAENIKIPFFIAKGNHDSREQFEKNAFPLHSSEVRTEVDRTFFSFSRGNCHFIILDCTADDLTSQLLWLENDLKSASNDPSTNHIFVAGHYPLWIAARAGFTRQDYAKPVSTLLARYKVDAYFCGHTHNKTITVRVINGQPLTQIMDAGVIEVDRLFNLAPFLRNIRSASGDPYHPGLLPLEDGHQIFIPKSELRYYRGYQEGSTSSYWIIKVSGKRVRADWHFLGQGLIHSFSWDEPGVISEIIAPPDENAGSLISSDLEHVKNAWLYASPWTDEDSLVAPFSINGVEAGKLKISKKGMAASPFWNTVEVPLNEKAIDALKMENEIILTNPESRRFGLAHIFVLIQLENGRFAKTSVSQKVLTSFRAPEGQYLNFPAAELIESVDCGKPVGTNLKFSSFYVKSPL